MASLSEFASPGGSPTFDERGAIDDWFSAQGAPDGPAPPSTGAPAAAAGGQMPAAGEVDWNAPPDQLAQQLTAYYQKRGVAPTEVPYWVSHAKELVDRGRELGDPNYANMRLSLSESFGGPTYGSPGGGAGGMQGALETSPGYQFRLGEGLKAIERSAAAKGTLLTGGTLKGLARYGQDYASGEYNNRYNQLLGLTNIGANAAAGQAGANTAYGNTAGNLLTDQGNAAAAGTIGGANAWQQPIGQASNLAQMYYLSRLMNPSGTAPGGTPPYLPASTPNPLQGTRGTPLMGPPLLAAGGGNWMDPWIRPGG